MAPSNGLRVSPNFFPPCKVTRGSHVSAAWKCVLIRHGMSRHLVLGVPASRNVRSTSYLFQPPVWGDLLQQPELTETMCIVTP